MHPTAEALKRFDTDGSPIVMGKIKWTKRGTSPKKYQTPYSEVEIQRHVYQNTKGGRIYCPLEAGERIVRHAMPRFAKQLEHKYAQTNVNAVCQDLRENHRRKIAASYVQNNWVGSIACAREEHWEYAMPKLDATVATVAVSLDRAMLPMQEVGWRDHGRHACPCTLPTASVNCSIISMRLITCPIWLRAPFRTRPTSLRREQWLHERKSRSKHEPKAVDALIEEAERLTRKKSLSKTVRENLQAALTYFANRRERMDYARHIVENPPIGSGVVEAACQDPGQTASVRRGHTLEASRGEDRLELKGAGSVHRALSAILAKNRPVRCSSFLNHITAFQGITRIKID